MRPVVVSCRGCGTIFTYFKKAGQGRIRRHCTPKCRMDARVRREREERARKRLADGPHLCGCGQDYLTVEIDHRCANPLPVLDSYKYQTTTKQGA